MGVSRGNDFMLPIPPFLLSETVHSLLILQTLAHDVKVYVYFIILYQIKSFYLMYIMSNNLYFFLFRLFYAFLLYFIISITVYYLMYIKLYSIKLYIILYYNYYFLFYSICSILYSIIYIIYFNIIYFLLYT